MIQRVLTHYHLPLLTCAGLILFMMIFFGALIWIFRRGSAEIYQSLENLPFQDYKEKG